MGKKKKKKKLDLDKSLCELVQEEILEDFWEDYLDLVRDPDYVCEKCGRAAHQKKNLCHPCKLK